MVYIYFGLAILVILVIGLFRDSIFSSGDTGTIVISHLDESSIIFLDNQENGRINKPRDNVSIKRIDSGFHSILISRDGYWPWLKEIEINSGETTKLFPFFVPQNTNGFLIEKEDVEYDELINQLNLVVAPSFENKKISDDEKVAIWVDSNTLFNEWLGDEEERPEYYCNEFGCHNVLVSLGVGAGLRNADFYKNRNDIFIVSFSNGIFAIEADVQNNQNFQPIFEGGSPEFVLNDENSIYILNGDTLMQVAI
jgi:hypothetical protein